MSLTGSCFLAWERGGKEQEQEQEEMGLGFQAAFSQAQFDSIFSDSAPWSIIISVTLARSQPWLPRPREQPFVASTCPDAT